MQSVSVLYATRAGMGVDARRSMHPTTRPCWVVRFTRCFLYAVHFVWLVAVVTSGIAVIPAPFYAGRMQLVSVPNAARAGMPMDARSSRHPTTLPCWVIRFTCAILFLLRVAVVTSGFDGRPAAVFDDGLMQIVSVPNAACAGMPMDARSSLHPTTHPCWVVLPSSFALVSHAGSCAVVWLSNGCAGWPWPCSCYPCRRAIA